MNSFDQVFQAVKDYCKNSDSIADAAFNLWINPIEARRLDGQSAYLYVQSEFQKGIILTNYEALLKEAFHHTLGFDVSINILTQDDTPDNPPPPPVASFEEIEQKHQQLERSFVDAEYQYTFDTFIVGRSNEFAYAACTAVARPKDPDGSTYNPLFIHGPSGLGKTHLLMAIQNEIGRLNPELNIIYVTGETFANELIDAIKMKKDTSNFHEKYRNADVLLVDDIQFIAGKESTQEEFFHTFNELHKEGRQIVLSSDKPPKDIKTLEDRIKSRFEWGLIADISAPDFETRMAIIRRKAELLDIAIPDEICEFIANRLKNNIRQLEGAVMKLKALRHFTNKPLTISMAQSVIRDILTDDQPIPITVEKIIAEVANVYGVTVDDIRSNKRSSQISTARKVAMYVVREITQMSLVSIGTEFGNRDHSTVVYAISNIESHLKKDANLNNIINDIIKDIRDKGK